MKNLVKRKFGRLTVLKFDKKVIKQNGYYKYYWLCKCTCGIVKSIRKDRLYSGETKSCGCLSRELASERFKKTPGMSATHGMSNTRVYISWISMKGRCLNKNNKAYKNYGGRGIKVCERWMKFENFYSDMGDRAEDLSLDRIDNDGNYCKSNCRYATRKEQQRNTRNNVNVTYKGRTQCLTAWREELKSEVLLSNVFIMNIKTKKKGRGFTNNEIFIKINKLKVGEFIVIKKDAWQMKTPLTSFVLRRRLFREFKVECLADDSGHVVTAK